MLMFCEDKQVCTRTEEGQLFVPSSLDLPHLTAEFWKTEPSEVAKQVRFSGIFLVPTTIYVVASLHIKKFSKIASNSTSNCPQYIHTVYNSHLHIHHTVYDH